ncbi:MAG: cell wall metabolism sensor histidine kinase WalK, partial [Proteobacteria bacterium]|nr:cell wall metabolism sensor histidine kinase WalK [Pseudomonadota bacterium]
MLIRTRLKLIGLLPLLLMMTFVGSFLAAQQTLAGFEEKASLADDLGKRLFDLIVLSRDLGQNKSARPRQQWPEIMQEVEAELPQAKKLFDGEEEQELLGLFVEHLVNSQRDFQELAQRQELEQLQGQALTPAQQAYRAQLLKRIEIDLESALPIAAKLHEINHQQAEAFSVRQRNIRFLLLLVFGSVSALVIWPVMRHITRTLSRLQAGMGRVAVAGFSERVEERGKDELAELARHFNAMTARLSEVTVSRDSLIAEVTERQRVEAELRESRAHLKEITDVLADGVMVVNTRSRVTFMNPEAERLLGWRASELADQDSHEVLHHRPDGSVCLRENCAVARALGTGEIHRWPEDYFCRKDGSFLPVSLVAAPIVREDQVVGSVVSFQDISERLAIQAALKHYAESLERSNKELEHFAYVASHDLQEPLRKIGSFTELLARKYQG